jgi:hypothetical protein
VAYAWIPFVLGPGFLFFGAPLPSSYVSKSYCLLLADRDQMERENNQVYPCEPRVSRVSVDRDLIVVQFDLLTVRNPRFYCLFNLIYAAAAAIVRVSTIHTSTALLDEYVTSVAEIKLGYRSSGFS